jgi:stage II sporulation protein D
MRRALLTALLLMPLALPASAGAATRWVVKGGGWGHGIGMSQYGAYGMARNGSSYRDILTHYYTGTEVSRADTQTIRVLLQTNRPKATFIGVSRAGDKTLSPKRTYQARVAAGGVELRDNKGRKVGSFGAPVALSSSDGFRLGGTAINGVTDGTYHGSIELRPSAGGGLTVVNALSLDSYVQGVVPGEMPSLWHPEALKAQAVAARSYALTTDKGGPVFDQYPDTRSQVYRGVSAETSSTNAAVRATAGEVVKYDGKVAVTYFFSTSGGHTENVENVFYGGQPAPYLRGVDDPTDSIAPRHRWTFTFTNSAITAKLRPYLRGGKLKAVKVRKRGVSPRIVSADVVSSKGSRRVTGTNLRQSLGTHDNWMTFKRVTTSATKATSVRKAGLAALVFGGGRGIVGTVDPARPGSKLVVERRDRRGRWHRAEVAKVGERGRYRVALERRGTYRVKSGGAAGPAVRVH